MKKDIDDLFSQPKTIKKKREPKEKKSADRDPSITLNSQQEESIVLLREFLKDDSKKEFTIMGAGGCVDNQTEYLSSTGWNKISNYKGEEIAIYDNGNLKYELPIEHVCYPASDWYEINTKYGISQKLSEEHRVPYITSKGNLKVRSMKEVYDMHQQSKLGFSGKYITSFNPINGYELDITDDYLRLLIAASADGYCQTFGKGHILQWTFRLKKERKYTRIEMLLDKCNLEYKKRYQKSTGFNIYTFYLEDAFKVFPDIWYRLCKKQLQVICDEVIYWDGRYNGNSYYSTIKQNADFIQFCFSSCGYRSTIQEDNHRDKTCYIVNRSKRILVGMVGDENFKPEIKITKPLDNEFKYCFKTSTSFWIARRNGKIFITGNTGKTFLIQELFKRKKPNKDEWYVPNTVIGVCVTHMARLNLMKSIPNTTTYASAANLTMMYDPMGNVYFVEKYSNHAFSELKTYKYVVIDECSMFDLNMKNNLIKCCDSNAKIIWLGK